MVRRLSNVGATLAVARAGASPAPTFQFANDLTLDLPVTRLKGDNLVEATFTVARGQGQALPLHVRLPVGAKHSTTQSSGGQGQALPLHNRSLINVGATFILMVLGPGRARASLAPTCPVAGRGKTLDLPVTRLKDDNLVEATFTVARARASLAPTLDF